MIIGLIIWITLLTWLSASLLRYIGVRTGWRPLDWRNMLGTLVFLTGAIHLGNFAVECAEVWIKGTGVYPALGLPNVFLIGSIAIGVGIAGVRWHRKL